MQESPSHVMQPHFCPYCGGTFDRVNLHSVRDIIVYGQRGVFHCSDCDARWSQEWPAR